MMIGVRPHPLKLKSDFPGLVNWLAQNGFEAVDLIGFSAEAKALCDKAGLAIGSFDCPSLGKLLDADEAKRNAVAAKVKDELSQAAKLGLKTLFICFGPVDKTAPRAKTFEIWKSVFPGIAAHCEALGISIAMEPWPGGAPHYSNIGTTPEMWRAMFAACPSQALGLCYDPSHMARLGVDYVRALKEFGPRIHHVHAKDCAFLQEELYLQGRMTPTFGAPTFKCSEGWWRYCIPGDGVVDWRTVVVGLTALGFKGVLSIEPEDGVYMETEEANKAGLLAAKAHLKSVIR